VIEGGEQEILWHGDICSYIELAVSQLENSGSSGIVLLFHMQPRAIMLVA